MIGFCQCGSIKTTQPFRNAMQIRWLCTRCADKEVGNVTAPSVSFVSASIRHNNNNDHKKFTRRSAADNRRTDSR